MTRTRKRNQSKKKRSGGGAPQQAMIRSSPRSARPSLSQQASEYLRLLSDPCHGKLVPAPYAGMGSSMLVRTTDYYSFGPVSGSGGVPLDLVAEWTPWNYPVAFTSGASASGGGSASLTNQEPFIGNFVLSPAVHSYRPIAGCLKWIPTGKTMDRSGLVGMSYSPSKTISSGDIMDIQQGLSLAQQVASNGSEQHEMLWLPSFGDERFSKYDEVNINGAGSIIFVGKDIDATSTGSANGVLECTVVWEWVPSYGNSITSSPAAPSSTTLQQVLAQIKDVGAFVRGTRAAINMGVSLVGRWSGTRGPGFLTN